MEIRSNKDNDRKLMQGLEQYMNEADPNTPKKQKPFQEGESNSQQLEYFTE